MTDELIKYLLQKDAKDISINLSEKEAKYIIDVKSKIYISEEQMQELSSNFARHKDLEYEFLWELVGEYSDEDELELLFMIADDIRIYYENEILHFILELKK